MLRPRSDGAVRQRIERYGEGRGVPNPVASQALDAFPETQERPLFAPSRRPMAVEKPAVVPVAQAPQPDTSPNVVLAGSSRHRGA